MKIYYSPSAHGFFVDELHGGRTILVADPNWIAPEPEEPKEGEDPKPAPTAPLIEVPNPDTKIPEDGIEITEEQHHALLAGQGEGKRITAQAGQVVLVDQPPLSNEQLRANLIATRDYRLTASDWTQLADVPLTDAKKAEWRAYRKALRDLPDTVTDLNVIAWPDPPAK